MGGGLREEDSNQGERKTEEGEERDPRGWGGADCLTRTLALSL